MLFLKPGVKKKNREYFFSLFVLLAMLRKRLDSSQFRRICIMESPEHNWANISSTIFPEMLVFGK